MHATAGNISARLAGWILITPSDACLGFLEPDIARVGVDGAQLSGARASKALALHRSIYETDLTAACVIHTHSIRL